MKTNPGGKFTLPFYSLTIFVEFFQQNKQMFLQLQYIWFCSISLPQQFLIKWMQSRMCRWIAFHMNHWDWSDDSRILFLVITSTINGLITDLRIKKKGNKKLAFHLWRLLVNWCNAHWAAFYVQHTRFGRGKSITFKDAI